VTNVLDAYGKAFVEATIDTEGYISMFKHKDKRVKVSERGFFWKVVVGVNMTSKAFLDKLQSICGCGKIYSYTDKRNPNCKELYAWILRPNEIRELLPQLQLVIKEEQRVLALEALRLLEEHRKNYRPNDASLEVILSDIQRLNKRGKCGRLMTKVGEYTEE
jgi:hypothetical protein